MFDYTEMRQPDWMQEDRECLKCYNIVTNDPLHNELCDECEEELRPTCMECESSTDKDEMRINEENLKICQMCWDYADFTPGFKEKHKNL